MLGKFIPMEIFQAPDFGKTHRKLLKLFFALKGNKGDCEFKRTTDQEGRPLFVVTAKTVASLQAVLWQYLAEQKGLKTELERSKNDYPLDVDFGPTISGIKANIALHSKERAKNYRPKGAPGVHFEFFLSKKDTCSYPLSSERFWIEQLPEVVIAEIITWRGNNAIDQQSSSPRLPPISKTIPYNLPLSGVSEFVGRNNDMVELNRRLGTLKPNEYLAIVGMGGIGKTELGIQYAMRYCDSYDGGIAWIRVRGGEDPVTQLLSFALVNGYQLNPVLPPHSQLAAVWSAWQAERTLIIFDDVDNLNDIKAAIPPMNDRFLILLTTRYRFGSPVELMELDKLSEEASLALLKSIVGTKRIEQEIDYSKQLYKFVDGLPLGLELVGRFLKNRSDLSVRGIVAKLEAKRSQWRKSDVAVITDSSLQFNPRDLSTAQRGAMACFELTWDQLTEDARDLGKLLCSYDESLIVWKRVHEVLLALAAEEDEEFANIPDRCAELISFSLLKVHREGEYYYHPLLKDFFRSRMTPEEIEMWGQEIN